MYQHLWRKKMQLGIHMLEETPTKKGIEGH